MSKSVVSIAEEVGYSLEGYPYGIHDVISPSDGVQCDWIDVSDEC
jgi:hypothetical protein